MLSMVLRAWINIAFKNVIKGKKSMENMERWNFTICLQFITKSRLDYKIIVSNRKFLEFCTGFNAKLLKPATANRINSHFTVRTLKIDDVNCKSFPRCVVQTMSEFRYGAHKSCLKKYMKIM